MDGLIPAAGIVLVTGEDKAGKTTFCAQLILCHLYALPFLGRTVAQTGFAIIVSEEDDGDELRDRMRAIHHALALAYPDRVALPDDPVSLDYVAARLIWEAREGVRLDSPEMITSVVEQITALRRLGDEDGPPVLVTIDSLQAVRGLLDPTKPDGVAVLKAALRRLAAAGAVVVLIAHARKVVSGGKRTSRASQEVAASHELAAEAAATIGLMNTGPRADAPVRLDLVTKRGKSGTIGYLKIAHDPPDTWPPATITITVEESPASSGDARAATSERKVLDALKILAVAPAATGQPGISHAAIKAATKLGEKTVRRVMDRLIAAGTCLVTGHTTNQAKLYARNPNVRA